MARLRSAGTDITVQQELLRHANIQTTMNLYTQAVSHQKRAANSKVVEMVLSGSKATAVGGTRANGSRLERIRISGEGWLNGAIRLRRGISSVKSLPDSTGSGLSTPRFLLPGKSQNISTAASGSINIVNQRHHTQQRQVCGDRVYQPVHPKRAQSDAAQREKGKQSGQGMEG